MSQWKRLRKSKRRMSSPCTKSTTMLSSPWTLWRPSTHMMTHEAWIFEDVELVLKNMQLAKFFSHRMESTRSSLVSFWLNEHHSLMSSIELSWTKAWGYTSWQRERRRW
ncbi:unnamed protein product [Microthlaspi erraticum]|uniref:Uncharacterized protein n=1 Tax=Microthlaspi erraticum TaxID=1685480 RepID=A0A6D2L5J0_9BRAS|nr:unnamed protein product [Microthlaspi erraticum]